MEFPTEAAPGFRIATREPMNQTMTLIQSNELKQKLGISRVLKILQPLEIRREYLWDMLAQNVMNGPFATPHQFIARRMEKYFLPPQLTTIQGRQPDTKARRKSLIASPPQRIA